MHRSSSFVKSQSSHSVQLTSILYNFNIFKALTFINEDIKSSEIHSMLACFLQIEMHLCRFFFSKLFHVINMALTPSLKSFIQYIKTSVTVLAVGLLYRLLCYKCFTPQSYALAVIFLFQHKICQRKSRKHAKFNRDF